MSTISETPSINALISLAKLKIEEVTSRDEEFSKEHQELLAKILNLLQDIDKLNDTSLISSAEIALISLLKEKNYILAEKIYEELKWKVRLYNNPLLGLIMGSSPISIRISFGLATFLFSCVLVLWILLGILQPVIELAATTSGLPSKDIGHGLLLFCWISFMGALGSGISILLRINELSSQKFSDPLLPFFNGFLKPITGMSLAIVTVAFLKAGFLPIEIKADKEIYFFTILAFVTGFSERFAKDILARAETVILTDKTIKK